MEETDVDDSASIGTFEQQFELEQLQEARDSLHSIRSESIGLKSSLRTTGAFDAMQLAEVENALNTLEAAKSIVENEIRDLEAEMMTDD